MNNRRTWIIAATLAVLAGGGCCGRCRWRGCRVDHRTGKGRPSGKDRAGGRPGQSERTGGRGRAGLRAGHALHVVLSRRAGWRPDCRWIHNRSALPCAVPKPPPTLRAQHAASQARYRQALRTYDRQSQLVASRLVSQEGFEAARVARDAARADAAALQAQIDQAVTQVETARINLATPVSCRRPRATSWPSSPRRGRR